MSLSSLSFLYTWLSIKYKQKKESASESKRWKIFWKKHHKEVYSYLIPYYICSFIICFVRTHETYRASCTDSNTLYFITNNVNNVRPELENVSKGSRKVSQELSKVALSKHNLAKHNLLFCFYSVSFFIEGLV